MLVCNFALRPDSERDALLTQAEAKLQNLHACTPRTDVAV